MKNRKTKAIGVLSLIFSALLLFSGCNGFTMYGSITEENTVPVTTVAAVESSTEAETTAEATTAMPEESTLPEAITTKTSLNVGDIICTDGMYIQYLESGYYQYSTGAGLRPTGKTKYRYIIVTIKNVSDSVKSFYPTDFSCTADGQSCSASSFISQYGVTICPGRTMSRTICFNVSEYASRVEYQYKPSSAKETYTFVFEEDKSSTKHSIMSEDSSKISARTYSINNTAVTDKYKITFNSVSEDKSKLVIMGSSQSKWLAFKFTVENTSASTITVTDDCFQIFINQGSVSTDSSCEFSQRINPGATAEVTATYYITNSTSKVSLDFVPLYSKQCVTFVYNK